MGVRSRAGHQRGARLDGAAAVEADGGAMGGDGGLPHPTPLRQLYPPTADHGKYLSDSSRPAAAALAAATWPHEA